jgi:hypothetical protein
MKNFFKSYNFRLMLCFTVINVFHVYIIYMHFTKVRTPGVLKSLSDNYFKIKRLLPIFYVKIVYVSLKTCKSLKEGICNIFNPE